ncbi:MAG TPA: hypothetical protein EYQ50_17250 [Verrucomicrobiales bacterium]|nr:hypothetical protein [Verrucomicrobiales bacterium]HIL72039.1 hypothetical protein [Verrucomicrobiota bacterium]
MTSWSENPSSAEINHALRKGFGRAYHWAKAGNIPTETLLNACLSDYHFNWQLEESRGDWLWQLISAASLIEHLTEPVLEAIENIREPIVGHQLCEIARHYVLAGDERFRLQLQRIVKEKPVMDAQWLGEQELIRLEDSDGFLTAVIRHGADLESREWDWFDATLTGKGIEWLGRDCTIELLNSHAVTDDRVRRFNDLWLKEQQQGEDTKRVPYRERYGNFTLEEIITAAESSEKKEVRFQVWGRGATDTDLSTVYDRLLTTSHVETLQRYLRVFETIPWPRYDARLLQLCLHDDKLVRHRAAVAIANNHDPEVRRFALEHLETPKYQEHSIRLLGRNYEQGDENRILDVIELPDDEDHLHEKLMRLMGLVKRNKTADLKAVGKLIYERTPCSFCRNSIVELLDERIGLPEAIRTECRFDVEADTRKLAGGPSWSD